MNYMDLLSKLGIASAHPGGFKATRKFLDSALPPGDLHILEVGCGTGKSACYLAKQGYRVTALDRHPLMLQKARLRAAKEGIDHIRWVEGSVLELPFADETFDVVYAESVTIFSGLEPSLQEYYRVLKPNGRLLDREMVLCGPISDSIYEEIKAYFEIDKIHSAQEWLECLHRTGFACDPPVMEAFRSPEPAVEENEIGELDLLTLLDPEIGSGLLKYTELMLAQESCFRACNFTATKN